MSTNITLPCGWGRLIFAQTFEDNQKIIDVLREEKPGQRDIIFYPTDPHVVISLAPQEVFLDPSHTYRLYLTDKTIAPSQKPGFTIENLQQEQIEAVYNLYLKHHMIPPEQDFVTKHLQDPIYIYLVAKDQYSEEILGAVLGIDHVNAFSDTEQGSSLWALVVDPQAPYPGIGKALVENLASIFAKRKRHFMDLSVLYDNEQAIKLYEKIGFKRIAVFALKHKNPHNEPLFIGPQPTDNLNIYAQIIVNEALQRGIVVEVLDAEEGYFALSLGGRTVICRESLTELTTAVAMSRCDNKIVTHKILNKAGLYTPTQMIAKEASENVVFLYKYKQIVVKPARGEQGQGISVDIRDVDTMESAIAKAKLFSDRVILEEYVTGIDLRIIVIDYQVVAAAIRCPPEITGTGQHSIRDLISAQSRRRSAVTSGESKIPIDDETIRCIRNEGFELEDILFEGQSLTVRKTANLHTGGTIHDVTDSLSDTLREAAIKAALELNIPVVGLDFLVPDVSGEEYVIIEANERPGLANHEPQPTAKKFIDFLFPQTVVFEN